MYAEGVEPDPLYSAYAASREEKQARLALKVKESVLKFGTGQSARVKVKLRDKTRLQGYISAVDDERFTVTDSTGMATTATYPQVKSVQGNNLSTGARIAIGVGFAEQPFSSSFGIQRPG